MILGIVPQPPVGREKALSRYVSNPGGSPGRESPPPGWRPKTPRKKPVENSPIRVDMRPDFCIIVYVNWYLQSRP